MHFHALVVAPRPSTSSGTRSEAIARHRSCAAARYDGATSRVAQQDVSGLSSPEHRLLLGKQAGRANLVSARAPGQITHYAISLRAARLAHRRSTLWDTRTPWRRHWPAGRGRWSGRHGGSRLKRKGRGVRPGVVCGRRALPALLHSCANTSPRLRPRTSSESSRGVCATWSRGTEGEKGRREWMGSAWMSLVVLHCVGCRGRRWWR